MLTNSVTFLYLYRVITKNIFIFVQGDPKEGVPGEPIEVNEEGTTVEVTFETEPGEEPEIGTIKTKACIHPSKLDVDT